MYLHDICAFTVDTLCTVPAEAGGSEAGMGDQSVYVELMFKEHPSVFGNFTQLDLCWNFRGWCVHYPPRT